MEPTDAPPRPGASPDATSDAAVDATSDVASDATSDATPTDPAPVVAVTSESPARHGVSVPMLLAAVLVVGALTAAFVTIWSLNSDLDAQEALVADLQEDVDALEQGVAGNAQAVADAAARADSLQAQAEASSETGATAAEPAISATPEGALPRFAGNGQPDAAIGQQLPEIAGVDHLTGAELGITEGTPAMVMLWAHWCPFCQEELPVVEELYAEGAFADAGVDLVTIATFEDPERGNPFEPYVEQFSMPVIRDDRGRAALLGIDGVPSWVAVDAEGTVIGRVSGRLGEEALRSIIDQVANS